MNLPLDMNLPPSLCRSLERGGHVARHWSSVGEIRAEDAAILKWAIENGFVVLTHDLDFGAILAATGSRCPSVVQIRTQDILSNSFVDRLLFVLKECADMIAAGALVTLDERRRRIRALPILK